jgi:hypothetical protein
LTMSKNSGARQKARSSRSVQLAGNTKCSGMRTRRMSGLYRATSTEPNGSPAPASNWLRSNLQGGIEVKAEQRPSSRISVSP